MAVACGGYDTIALKSDGMAWATGRNDIGQLGIGATPTSTSVLTLMATETNSNIRAIATGNNHTLVLRSDGKVWATGSGLNGKLGNGTTANKDILTEMTTDNSNIIAIAGGFYHSILLKSDGTVWGAGRNNVGQLGLGTPTTDKLIPTKMVGADNSNIKAIGAGNIHTVALKSDGTAWATGSNSNGQLGDSTNSQRTSLTLMTDNNANISAIVAGLTGFHTIALKSDGTVYGTGRNDSGQLGDGTLDNKNILTEMAPFLS
jgi:hypothetical protein